MSNLIGALRVAVSADVASFFTGMTKAERKAAHSAASINKSLGSIRNRAGALFAGFSVAILAREVAKFADTSSRIQAQLKLATAETGNFAKAQEDVRRIAKDSRSDLDAVANLYGTMSRNSASLGATQEQVARATETVTKAFKISGAAQSESANATRQLSQALASGVLRGDEFNSVMENAPRLAKLLADSLGVPIGKLRQMAEEGELTSDKLFKALTDKKFTAGLDAEFKQVPVTFDDAMTAITNLAVETFGAFDRGGQFSKAIFQFAQDGGDNMEAIAAAAEKAGMEIRATFAGLSDVFDPMKDGAFNVMDAIERYFGNSTQRMRAEIGGILSLLDFHANRNPALVALNQMRALVGKDPIVSNMSGNFQAGFDASLRELNLGKQARTKFGDASIASIQASTRTTVPVTPSSKKTGGGRKGPSAETLRKRAEAEAKREADARRRFTDESTQNEADIVSAQAEYANSLRQKAAAEINQIEVRRAADERAIEARDELTQAEKKTLLEQNRERAAAETQIVQQREDERLRAEAFDVSQAQLDLRLELLQNDAGNAQTAAERRRIELRILDLAIEQERAKLQETIATNEATSAAAQIAELRLAELDKIKAQQTESIRQGTMGPLESYLNTLPRSADELNVALENVAADGLASIEDGLLDVIKGTKSLGAAFREMAAGIIEDLLRIAIQRSITIPLANALFPGGSLGGANGVMSGGSMSGGGGIFGAFLKIAGMVAGSARFGNTVPFAGATGSSTFTGSLGGHSLGGLQGFASGGSMRIGGHHGLDMNLLQVNGMPVARVSRGELLSIDPNDQRPTGNSGPLIGTFAPVFPGVTNAKEARPVAAQSASTVSRKLARAKKGGF